MFFHTLHDFRSILQQNESRRKSQLSCRSYRVVHRIQIKRVPWYLEINPSRYHRNPYTSRVSPSARAPTILSRSEKQKFTLSLSHRTSDHPQSPTEPQCPQSFMIASTKLCLHEPNLSSARYQLGYLVVRPSIPCRLSPSTGIQRQSTVDIPGLDGPRLTIFSQGIFLRLDLGHVTADHQ